MQDTAEQLVPEPSLFGRIMERFRGKLFQGVETPAPIFPVPEPEIKTATPVTVQKLGPSREERRAKEKAAYEQWKTAKGKTSPPVSAKATIAPVEIVTSQVSEVKPANLPPGIKERVKFPQGLLINRAEIRWLEEDQVQVPLELVTLDTTKEEQFLYGSLIHGKKLKRLLREMTKGELDSADDLLFVQLSELIQKGVAPDIEMLHNHITARPIFETGNRKGQECIS